MYKDKRRSYTTCPKANIHEKSYVKKEGNEQYNTDIM